MGAVKTNIFSLQILLLVGTNRHIRLRMSNRWWYSFSCFMLFQDLSRKYILQIFTILTNVVVYSFTIWGNNNFVQIEHCQVIKSNCFLIISKTQFKIVLDINLQIQFVFLYHGMIDGKCNIFWCEIYAWGFSQSQQTPFL